MSGNTDRRGVQAERAPPIVVVTALAVLLHRTRYPPPASVRWVLGRIDPARPLASADASSVGIAVRQQIGAV